MRSVVGRWLYRSRQFFAALGRVGREEEHEARQVLGPQLYGVFAAMPRQYRLHSLQVYRRVRQMGCTDEDVWRAALLHDSGKYDPASGRYVTIVHRVLVVLLGATRKGRSVLKWLSRPVPERVVRWRLDYWRYPFYLSWHHPDLGARLASRNGASEQLVDLIARHHVYSSQSPELEVLQSADGKS